MGQESPYYIINSTNGLDSTMARAYDSTTGGQAFDSS